ncbi:hypothetical protein MSP7336_02879 [Mycobacterium shimoidei]|uniref:DUF4386 domain-containing protein n=1 Tax=Mycobacterium shimoidei TaxID=29313 RepID=A0A375Z0Z2_MYCSH|nr:hypothetical protein [Mycobacterium shimoidei]SRX94620.1 hypothetical protein MSP7336_02879 [Mycobacterium shimoidei]
MNSSAADAKGRHRGLPLVVWAALSLGLLFGAIAVGVVLGGVMPLPYGPAGPIRHYVATQPTAVHVMAVGVFASAVPLAVYAATVSARLRQLGASAVAATIALTGGTLAAGALATTGLVGWILSRPDISPDRHLIGALYYLAFLTGGPAHIVALGLLVIGMSMPSLKLRLLPQTLARVGVGIGAFAELATLVLIWSPLAVMLPIARVAGLLWLLVAAALLPLQRNDVRAT